jgi:defect-in-organelle-trafficking protein DotA
MLGVFLRPVLMVIGMFASILLSFVGLEILIVGYSGLMSDLFSSTPSSTLMGTADAWSSANHMLNNANLGSGFSATVARYLILLPSTIVIFAMMVYLVMTQSFSLIYAIPDHLMRWIGTPTQSSGTEQMANQVKGVTHSAGDTAGNLGGSAADIGGKAALGIPQARQHLKKQK